MRASSPGARTFAQSFVKEIVVMPGQVPLRHTVAPLVGSPVTGGDGDAMALDRPTTSAPYGDGSSPSTDSRQLAPQGNKLVA